MSTGPVAGHDPHALDLDLEAIAEPIPLGHPFAG